MKWKLITVVVFIAVVVVACSGETTNEESSIVEIETKHLKELVDDYSLGNKNARTASITSQQLIVTDTDGNELAYNLPEDEFFVSIAPYVNETHT